MSVLDGIHNFCLLPSKAAEKFQVIFAFMKLDFTVPDLEGPMSPGPPPCFVVSHMCDMCVLRAVLSQKNNTLTYLHSI